MKPAPPVTRYEATRSPSRWETAVRQAGRQLDGVLVIQLPEHGIGQADAVELPERMVVAIVVEVLVVGLEHAPVVRILVGLVGVLAEHDPILVLHEEVVRGPRLPADVVQHGPDFRGQIRHPVEHRAEARQVVRVPPHVRDDEVRPGMPGEQSIALGHQVLERRKPRAVGVTAVGIERQLEPALVPEVDRLEELRRVGCVNVHRNLQPRADLPDGVELRVVELQPRAVGLLRGQAEVLQELAQALRSGFHVVLDLLRGAGAESRADRVAKVDRRERDHAVGIRAVLDDVEHLGQAVAGSTRHVHHQLQVLAVHRLDDSGVGVSGDRSRASERVPVDVHDRKLRPGHGVLRHDERRARLVFADARRRKLGLAALSRPRAKLSGRLRGDHGQRAGGDERERRGARGQVAEHKRIAAGRKPNSVHLRPLARASARRPFL